MQYKSDLSTEQVDNAFGAEPSMIQGALFKQIAIYFLLPLALAVVHSIVGLVIINQFLHAMHMISTLPYILITAGIVLVIYGIYLIATYFGCRCMSPKYRKKASDPVCGKPGRAPFTSLLLFP